MARPNKATSLNNLRSSNQGGNDLLDERKQIAYNDFRDSQVLSPVISASGTGGGSVFYPVRRMVMITKRVSYADTSSRAFHAGHFLIYCLHSFIVIKVETMHLKMQ